MGMVTVDVKVYLSMDRIGGSRSFSIKLLYYIVNGSK